MQIISDSEVTPYFNVFRFAEFFIIHLLVIFVPYIISIPVIIAIERGNFQILNNMQIIGDPRNLFLLV